MFFRRWPPSATNAAGSLVPIWSRTAAETQIPPGSAKVCSRAAMLTPSPSRFAPSTTTSPRCTPMRNCMRSPAGRSAFSAAIACWTAIAHSTASTALAKSASTLSPAVVNGDQPVEDRPRGAQCPQRADLVQLHQMAVADDIGRENRGQFSFDHLAVCHPGGLLAGTVPDYDSYYNGYLSARPLAPRQQRRAEQRSRPPAGNNAILRWTIRSDLRCRCTITARS